MCYILIMNKDVIYIEPEDDITDIITKIENSKEKIVAEVTLPTTIILKNKRKITRLKNLINDDNIRVNVSLQNNTMHLRLAPYQVLWLDLSGKTDNGE